MKIGILGWQTN